MKYCLYCGTEIAENNVYCPSCGKKQVMVYTQTFTRGKMSEDEFISQINQWFAQYPHVANVKGQFLIHSGTGLFVNKYVLDALAIEYEVFSNPNENQYAVINLTNKNIVKTTTDELLACWKQANPGATVIARNGGVNQRGSSGSLVLGGFGAVNNTQLYVLFKFNRNKGPGIA